jgi:hypothetical protein
MISYQFITELYLKNKNLNATQLWYELCKEYCRRSKTRWHGLKPYPLADFVNQYCVTPLEKISAEEGEGKDKLNSAMTKVNTGLLKIKLEEVSAFLKLLRIFLSCYPLRKCDNAE